MTKRVRLRLKEPKPVGKKSRGKKQTIRARLPVDDEIPAESTSDYEIGRGKPPKEGQFKKGDGRPRPGRPKGVKNSGTLLLEAAHSKTPATIAGKKQNISYLQLSAMQLAKLAAEGNPKAIAELLNRIGELEARAAAGRPSTYPLSDADLEIIREVHGRLWQYKRREE
jgi:hypothetical protein